MTQTSTAAAQIVNAARAAKATAVAAFEAAGPRARKAAGRVLDAAEMDLNFALRGYEMAVRAENFTATEREIQTLGLAA